MSEQTKQLALQTLNEIKGEMAKRDETRYLMAMIMAISALESPFGWIPCSGNSKPKDGAYYVTLNSLPGQPRRVEVRCMIDGEWTIDGMPDKDGSVLAYYPKPAPWSGDVKEATNETTNL